MGFLFSIEKVGISLMWGKKDIRLLAKLCLGFLSAAARSDPEMINCEKRHGGWGRHGQHGRRGREGERQRGRSLFTLRTGCKKAIRISTHLH